MRMDKKKIKQSCIASALKECVAVVCGFVVVVCAFFWGGEGDGGWGAACNTSKTFLLIARHALTTGLQKCL